MKNGLNTQQHYQEKEHDFHQGNVLLKWER